MDFKIEPIQNPNIPPPTGQMPVPRPFFGSKKLWLAISGVVVILILVAVFFFMGRGAFSESGVNLKIDGPSEVSSGDLAAYKITYKNGNKVSLLNAKLNVFYPVDSIVARDGNVLSVTNESFDLGELAPGASGEKDLTAYIVGDRGDIKTIRASLSYRPATIQSAFQKEVSLATNITTLAVPITLGAPPTVIGGQSMSYLIDYRNQSSQDLENLRFTASYPTGFRAAKFSPQPASHAQAQDTWDIPKLKQGDGARITIQGTLSGNEKETKTVSVTLQKKISTPAGDVYIDFEKTEASSVISTPPLSLSVNLEDSTDYTAHLGDLLHYKLIFKNNNNTDITGLNLSAQLSGNMYDLSTVRTDGFFDSRTNTLSWNASSLPGLNILGPNQSGTAAFEVRLKSSFPGVIGARDSFVKVSVHIETPNVPTGLELDKLTADGELVTRISTSPTFSQKLILNDPVFGSSGPFPPVVNRKTVFTIRWSMVNPSNDVSPAKVTATLMPGVSWESRVRVAGTQVQPAYDARLNTVTWDLGTLPGGVGMNLPQYEADFQISITPSTNQVNQAVNLLKNVRFDGTDTFTKEKISRTIQDTSTSNVNDSKESGLVQQ